MKKIKNLLFVLTIMLISFLTINNVHAAEAYGLWVNGEEFTSEKTTIDCGEGTATFDNSTKTLTLNNATITEANDYWDTSIYYSKTYDLNLVLTGTNKILSASNSIISIKKDLTIEGTGNLSINTLTEEMGSLMPDYVIKAAGITINGVAINITNDIGNISYSVSVDDEPTFPILEAKDVILNDASLTIDGLFGKAIIADNVAITDSSLTIQGINFVMYESEYMDYPQEGIYAKSVQISGNSNVTISKVGYGIDIQYEEDATGVNISNGSILISTTYFAFGGDVVLNNYPGKIMVGWYENGQNADFISHEDFEKDSYYGYVKMGNFDTYEVTSQSTDSMIYVPSEAFEGEKIVFYGDWYNGLYDITSVKVFKTSDNSEVTSEVGYTVKNKEHSFTMPAYPITVKVTMKVTYSAIPKTISAKLDKYNAVKISWTRDNNDYNNYFDGCYIYYKKSTESTWTKISWTLKNYYIKTDLEPGVKYNFKVVPMIRTYNNNDKLINIQSIKSKLVNIYTLKKMNTPTVTKYSSKQVRVRWSKVEGASGYQIARSVYKSKNYSIVKTVNSNYVGYKLDTKANKTYYYKVRAYRLSDGKKIYGPWSDYKMFRLK